MVLEAPHSKPLAPSDQWTSEHRHHAWYLRAKGGNTRSFLHAVGEKSTMDSATKVGSELPMGGKP